MRTDLEVRSVGSSPEQEQGQPPEGKNRIMENPTTTMRRRMMVALAVALAVMTMMVGAASAAVQEQIIIPLEGVGLPHPTDTTCLGEDLVHTAGRLSITIAYTENDNRVSGHAHFNPMGAKLVGVESGREFVGTGSTIERFNEPVDGDGATTFSVTNSFKIIGKGQTPSLRVQGVTHLTVNAAGETTADVDWTSVTCS